MMLNRTLAGLVFLLATALPAAAQQLQYTASLSGAAEAPSNLSPGSGSALVTFDLGLSTMHVEASFADLVGTTTASHIHCCTALPGTGTAGVATQTPLFVGFPVGVTSGSYDHLFDMTQASSFNGAFVTAHGGTAAGAFAALLAGLAAGDAYFNVHTSAFPGGEIRGFLAPVPEPSTGALLLVGLGATAWVARRRRVG